MTNKYVITENQCILETYTIKTGLQKFLIDPEDYNRVKALHWIPRTDKLGSIYAVTSFRFKDNGKNMRAQIQLHKFVTSFKWDIVDHIDGNSQNNMKENLREVTVRQNCMNRGINKKSKHGSKGVAWNKAAGKFRAYIYDNYKNIHLGYFENLADAKTAYNSAAIRLFGEYARLNEV